MPSNILIVEDEWFIAEDNAHAMRRAGHSVVGPVASVKAALDLLALNVVDAAILDIQLNGETSYGLADVLMEKTIPLAFATGYGENDIPLRFAKVPLLQKPASPSAVAALIEKLLTE